MTALCSLLTARGLVCASRVCLEPTPKPICYLPGQNSSSSPSLLGQLGLSPVLRPQACTIAHEGVVFPGSCLDFQESCTSECAVPLSLLWDNRKKVVSKS